MKPYFVWHGLLGSNMIIILASVFLGLLFIRNKRVKKDEIFLLSLFIIICIICTIIRGRNFNFFISLVSFATLPFGDKRFTRIVFDNFLTIYSLVTSISLIVWLLQLFNLVPIIDVIPPLNSLKQHNYNVYPLLVSTSNSFRYYGVFDEPGVVGTISGILLCCQKFNFADKRTIVLLLSGLCSMSMFFYLLCAIYLILYHLFEKKNIKNVLAIILLIYALLFVIQSIPALNEIIGHRFEWNSETGKLAGDNRTSDLALFYLIKVFGTKEFWLGLSNASLFLEYMAGECNVYMTILVNGALLCLLYLIFMIIYGLENKRKWSTFILFMFVFIVSVYQRPFLFNAEFIFLWTYLARIDNLHHSYPLGN